MQNVFVDCETKLIEEGNTTPPIICTAVRTLGTAELFRGPDVFASLIQNPSVRIVGLNVAFDLGCLMVQRPGVTSAIFDALESDRVTDVGIRMQLLDIAKGLGTKRSYSLAALAQRALGEHVEKENTWRLRYAELEHVPISAYPRDAYEYPLNDVRIPDLVYELQEEYGQFLADQYRQTRYAFALRMTAATGLIPHRAHVATWKAKVLAEYNKRRGLLLSSGLMRPDGTRDTKAAKNAISAAAAREGFDLVRTDTGQISLSDDACSQSTNPTIRAYGEIGSWSSMLSKDAKILERSVVHTRFDLAASGRSTSSGKEEGAGNTQNFGRSGGVRECFAPPEGWCYGSADYSTLELCTFGQTKIDLFGACPLADAINAGIDCHLLFASRLIDLDYDQILARYLEEDPEIKKHRNLAKVGNFGFMGGLSAGSFVGYAAANGVIVDPMTAARTRALWIDTWQVQPFFDYIGAIARTTRRIHDPRADRWRGGVGFTDGCNTTFQGPAANAAKDALSRFTRACFDPSQGSILSGNARPCNFVHDEINAIMRLETAHECAHELSRIMASVAAIWTPNVRLKAEPVLSWQLSKDAKPVRDASGRLIPWGTKYAA